MITPTEAKIEKTARPLIAIERHVAQDALGWLSGFYASHCEDEAETWRRGILDCIGEVQAAVDGPTLAGECPSCEKHKQAVIDAMSVSNDFCERRESIIRKFVDVCFSEANRLANHCSDPASKRAEAALYEAASVGRGFLLKVSADIPKPEQPIAIATVQNVRNLIGQQTGLKNDL